MPLLECKRILHYPRLDTVLKVEELIKKNDGEYTRTELWQKLDKKIMYQTYKIILDYLEKSNKIAIKNDKVIWIFNPKLKKILTENSVEV